MSEYIERQKAYEVLSDYYHHSTMLQHLVLKDALLKVPAADVRPVVLCRDCKYYYKDADGYEMCDNSEGYDHVTEDGFCAWAVKREEKLMYEELVKRLRADAVLVVFPLCDDITEAADAIEELQATLCNWCAVCPEDKRDLSTCEIYESCRAKPPKEE